ncbi:MULTISPECIES: acyltransferase [Bradyrhizobium]|uniref:Acyltransferase n=1 Tax=Bradyrhizobium hipponense TaxID=2605638 RepID=A0A5S4YY44_9BRAD|nr:MULTISPECIES: acyltransferase [Bradyrhizobium]AWO92879.1 acyltransferase [Bradyrhizobium diazoefficiens]TYO68525.1 acyltransferase [Bradyrhizobium hipponense]
MNLDLLLQRLLGRPTCELAAGARLLRTARIRNIRRDAKSIRIGEHSIIRGELLTFAHGGRIEIGSWCYVGEGARIWSGCSISLGDRVLIAHGANLFDNLTHPINHHDRHKQIREIFTKGHPAEIDLDDRPIAIGDDTWVGAGAYILRGVQIGARAVIGAGAVVTKDVAADTIVAGNPAVMVGRVDESYV